MKLFSCSIWRLCGLLLVFGVGHSHSFSCTSQCFRTEPATCEELQAAIDCLNRNIESCTETEHLQLNHLSLELNCSSSPPTTTVATPVTVEPVTKPFSCPNVQLQSRGTDIHQTIIHPLRPVPSHCTVDGDSAQLQHCSLFMDSHLRPFASYHGGIQTCSLPGRWQLFRHSRLLVEVEGVAGGIAFNNTRLTKVLVTVLPDENCNPETQSYIATSNSPLPTVFTGASSPHNNHNSPIQLHTNIEGTLTTILATWINSTIVIRRIHGYLGVTLHVTGRMAFESEGLCTGCPRHQFINALSYSSDVFTTCGQSIKNRAIVNCFRLPGDVLHVTNISYSDACVYSMYNDNGNDVRAVMERMTSDATSLPNMGTVPARQLREVVTPVLINRITSTAAVSTDTTTTTTTTTTTVEGLASDASSQIPRSETEESHNTRNMVSVVGLSPGNRCIPLYRMSLLILSVMIIKLVST